MTRVLTTTFMLLCYAWAMIDLYTFGDYTKATFHLLLGIGFSLSLKRR